MDRQVRDQSATMTGVNELSYLVAFVKFPESSREYPVDCIRSDIVNGDAVIVRKIDGTMRFAVVSRTKFLDWDCGATLMCKTSEAIRRNGILEPPEGSPSMNGLLSANLLVRELRSRGWRSVPHMGKVHRIVLSHDQGMETMNIWIRRHGVDIQILEGGRKSGTAADGRYGITEGRFVRNYLSHSEINLYEHVLETATMFTKGDAAYVGRIGPIGTSDKRTPELKTFGRKEQDDFDSVLYEALGGDGDIVYVGGGLSLGPGGRYYDDGR